MARTNAFLTGWNDHRDVSVGGRRANDSVWAKLNTDNASQSDCCLFVSASVHGRARSSKEREKLGDDRNTVFTVELPDVIDENCKVNINDPGWRDSLGKIEAISPFLAAVKKLYDVRRAKLENPLKSAVEAESVLRQLREKYDELPNVVLPGGVKLDYALACVRVCEELLS